MAGGIDWFRWHHGSVTDPKFQLVAKKAGASVAEVIAVWAFLLERGCCNGAKVDVSGAGEVLSLPSAVVDRIAEELAARGLTTDGRIANPRRYYLAPSMRPSGGFWRGIRAAVFERDKFRCHYCGQQAARLECDHVIPVADGGQHTPDNLVTACFACNRAKAAMSLSAWEAVRGW